MRHVPLSVHVGAVFLVAAATLFVVSPAAVADTAGDFTYTPTSGSSATITAYIGSDTAVDIPATISDGSTVYSVTAIGENAFRGNDLVNVPSKALTSVTIPDSVTTIAANAFRGNVLTSVVIPDSVVEIGTYAFYNNELSSITIPDSLTVIDNNVFRGNALTSITIPDSVQSIGNNSFSDNFLTSVTIPGSVTSLGNGTFGGTNALSSVIFAGNAPTTFTAAGPTGSLGSGTGLTVYHYSGASGFGDSWNDYANRTVSAADSELSTTPAGSVVADGTTPYSVTVIVRDSTDAPVAGVPVAFAVPAGITPSAGSCTSAADGSCAITLTATAAITATLSVTIGSDPAVLTHSLVFTADPATIAPAGGSGPVSDPAAVSADPTGAALADTGADAAVPLALGGGLLALGLALLTATAIRRRGALA